MYNHIHVIANPAAGREQPVLSTLNRVFRQHDARWDIAITHQKGDGARLARQAVADGADLVVVYGGDGTVGDVAAGLLKSDVPLAILPGGTGNALADGLGIAPDLEAAAGQIFTSTARPLDMGEANGASFILRADMGLSVKALASQELKHRLGVLGYVVASLQALSQPPDLAGYRLTIDDQQFEAEGITCIITNHNDLGALGLKFSLTVQPDDNLLDVFMVGRLGDALAALASEAMQLGDLAANYMQHWQGREIHIEADPPQPVGLDGDPFDHTPLVVRVLPHAIRVLRPGP